MISDIADAERAYLVVKLYKSSGLRRRAQRRAIDSSADALYPHDVTSGSEISRSLDSAMSSSTVKL
jgi:hypothetical protein